MDHVCLFLGVFIFIFCFLLVFGRWLPMWIEKKREQNSRGG